MQATIIETQARYERPYALALHNDLAPLSVATELDGAAARYCDYLDLLEKRADTGGLRLGARQLLELAARKGLMAEWAGPEGGMLAAWYAAQRLDGASHKWADMMSHSQPPGCLTDREFLEGHCNGSQFADQPEVGDAYKRVADEAGVDTTGAVYVNGLAQFPGDPKAWVRGRGDVARVCAERGYNAEGAVTVKSGSRVEAPEQAVADDIVEQRVMQKLEKDPSLMLRDPAEVRHEAREEIKPHWTPDG